MKQANMILAAIGLSLSAVPAPAGEPQAPAAIDRLSMTAGQFAKEWAIAAEHSDRLAAQLADVQRELEYWRAYARGDDAIIAGRTP